MQFGPSAGKLTGCHQPIQRLETCPCRDSLSERPMLNPARQNLFAREKGLEEKERSSSRMCGLKWEHGVLRTAKVGDREI